MKYKAGDKVKIKTWGEMEREFGVGVEFRERLGRYVKPHVGHVYLTGQSKRLDELNIDRVVTVGKCFKNDFWAEEVEVHLSYDLVVGREEFDRYKESQKIHNRYEILDLRGYR